MFFQGGWGEIGNKAKLSPAEAVVWAELGNMKFLQTFTWNDLSLHVISKMFKIVFMLFVNVLMSF